MRMKGLLWKCWKNENAIAIDLEEEKAGDSLGKDFATGWFIFLLVVIGMLGMGQTAFATTSLPNGGSVSGAIMTAGEVTPYSFTAEAGEHIEIQVAETSGSTYFQPLIELYGPGGGDAILTHTGNPVTQMALTIAETGTYTLLVQDYRGDSTGEYDIYYVNIPGVDELGPLVNGGVVSNSIVLGDLDTYSFTAEAGEHIEIQIAETSGSTYFQPLIELYGPGGGDAILAHAGNPVAQMALTIAETGTYTLLVQDYRGDSTGEYNIYYVNIPRVDEPGPLVNDGVVSNSIVLGDLDTYSFTAEAGEHIEIQIAETSGST
ncbi:MAG: hypothetical protein JEZ12_26475, partial [Desulfobacterium sp.]|nr:hypothetical protein [Desulfobacterium sp.]